LFSGGDDRKHFFLTVKPCRLRREDGAIYVAYVGISTDITDYLSISKSQLRKLALIGGDSLTALANRSVPEMRVSG